MENKSECKISTLSLLQVKALQKKSRKDAKTQRSRKENPAGAAFAYPLRHCGSACAFAFWLRLVRVGLVIKIIPVLLLSVVVNSAFSQLAPTERFLPINLETVLKLAGADNLKIAEWRAKYELAVAQETKSKQVFLPTFSPGVFLLQHNGIAQNTNGTFIDVDKNNAFEGVGFSLNWRLGDYAYNYLAAKQKTKSAEFAYRAEKNRQILKSVQTYFDLTAAQAKLATIEQMLAKTEDIARQLELMVEQGIRYKSDLLLAKVSVNNARIVRARTNAEFMQQSAKLMELLNVQDNSLLMSVDSVLAPIAFVDALALANLDSAYAKRPEMWQAEYLLKALETSKKSVMTGLLIPDLRLGLTDGYFGRAFDAEGKQFQLFGGVQWNIPLGELLSGGARKEYEAIIKIGDIQREATKNAIREEILEAHAKLTAAQQQMNAAQEAVTLAEEAFEQSVQRQRQGTALPLEVFNAQEKLITVKLYYIDAIAMYDKAQYSLFVAMGNDL